jgi:hypothetical protein
MAVTPFASADAPTLSIILPFFLKLAEFRNVLPLNLPHFAQGGREVIVVQDENTEAEALVALVAQHPSVRWKVIVNDTPHAWRPPCKAINVGLRHARGRYVFVASPESAYAGDAPGMALAVADAYPDGIALGRVGFAKFDDLRDGRTIDAHCDAKIPSRLALDTFYGSICGPRAAFEAIEGYAESFTGWGSDDDNVRIRLEMAGYTLLACPTVRLLHMSFKQREGPLHPGVEWDPLDARIKCSPDTFRGNAHADWGRSFSRVAFASDIGEPGGLAPLDSGRALPAGACIPMRSTRRCRACGRRVFHERAQRPCAACQPSAPGAVPARGTASVARTP